MKKHIGLLMMAGMFAGLEAPIMATPRRKEYKPNGLSGFIDPRELPTPLFGEREFTIDGITVTATSEKNARRQVKRLKIAAKNLAA